VSVAAMVAANLAYAFEHSPGSVVVTLGSDSTYGLVRCGGVNVLAEQQGRELSSSSLTVLIATGTLAGLEAGASITVGGTAYLVREQGPELDPKLTLIHCVKQA
jgi:hypothetical protein